MTDETAKHLAEAMNRLAAAIERVAGPGLGMSLQPGIHVHHHGMPLATPPPSNPWPYPHQGATCYSRQGT